MSKLQELNIRARCALVNLLFSPVIHMHADKIIEQMNRAEHLEEER